MFATRALNPAGGVCSRRLAYLRMRLWKLSIAKEVKRLEITWRKGDVSIESHSPFSVIGYEFRDTSSRHLIALIPLLDIQRVSPCPVDYGKNTRLLALMSFPESWPILTNRSTAENQ